MAAAPEKTDVTLQSSDGQTFSVPVEHAFMSKHIKQMIEDTGMEDAVPIPCVNMEVLKKVMKYCAHHHNNPAREIEKPIKSPDFSEVVSEWDYKFIVENDEAALIDILQAANYLDIQSLVDLACGKIASMIHGKSVEEMREIFGIQNDFDPEEEARIREESKWCEDS